MPSEKREIRREHETHDVHPREDERQQPARQKGQHRRQRGFPVERQGDGNRRQHDTENIDDLKISAQRQKHSRKTGGNRGERNEAAVHLPQQQLQSIFMQHIVVQKFINDEQALPPIISSFPCDCGAALPD